MVFFGRIKHLKLGVIIFSSIRFLPIKNNQTKTEKQNQNLTEIGPNRPVSIRFLMPKTEKNLYAFSVGFFPIPTAVKTKRAHEHAQAYTDRRGVLDPLNHNAFFFSQGKLQSNTESLMNCYKTK
jgi:hypothetical protein